MSGRGGAIAPCTQKVATPILNRTYDVNEVVFLWILLFNSNFQFFCVYERVF